MKGSYMALRKLKSNAGESSVDHEVRSCGIEAAIARKVDAYCLQLFGAAEPAHWDLFLPFRDERLQRGFVHDEISADVSGADRVYANIIIHPLDREGFG